MQSNIVFFTLILLAVPMLSESQEYSTTEVNTIVDNKPTEKKNITIAFILPQDFIRFRKIQACITNQVSKINKGNWSFSKNFYIDRCCFN